MKKIILKSTFMLLALSLLTFTSCSDDDENTTGNSVTYDLSERSNSGVSGTVEFVELTDGQVQIELDLSGTLNGNTHPAHVHMNSAAFGGGILISLDPVDGSTGSSVTIVSTKDDGSSFDFSMVENLDAYVNVHKSASELDVVVAQGDIGSNLLTGEETTYNLNTVDIAGIDGTITFKERKNNFTLAVIELNGTPDGGMHPAHIHMNSAAETGGIWYSFNPVDGSSGVSNSDIRATDGGMALTYNDVITVDGYVNVHLSATELGTIVAQGDIGVNELTGESITYTLDEKDVAGISGEIKFEERKNGSILATIQLVGTPNGGMHPAHIHENDAATGGPIAVTFNPVVGDTGISKTTIRNLDDGSSFNYTSISSFNGYVNVHLSATELGTIVAQGNIGIN
ncbi:MAG: hypothetical protein HKO66_00925 [Saprospiraceae bacterium]|nr:superoxide dismutase family protein [Bacteroidia bacterium]NNL90770.1 hypothetical protein [Saprospiraceae bacterium]